MKRALTAGLLLILLTAVFAWVAYADKPTEYQAETVVIEELNPCTGLLHTLTINVTIREHIHNGRLIRSGQRTITTDTGFIGQGTEQLVINGKVSKFTQNDLLMNAAGDRIRAHRVYVWNWATDPPSTKVFDYTVTCVAN
jgi:hypothetical protein